MADSRLDIVLKQIDNKYGKGTVFKGNQYPPLARFSSGVFSIDAEVGGGLPRGRVLIFTGNESTGKTTVAKKAIATGHHTCRYLRVYVHRGRGRRSRLPEMP
jgi:RecA/RadA recombinase